MSPVTAAIGHVPTISVVLPVFNGGEYLEASVRSILGQTLSDFELIAIDDGSADSSLKILNSLALSDNRMRVVSRENRGLISTLNEGVQMARGAWIARMDADDIAEAIRFEHQMAWLKQTGADICGSWVRLFGTSNGGILEHPQHDMAIKAELLFGSPFAHPTVVMRRELALSLPYDTAWAACEDYELWGRVALAGWRMTNIPEVLLHYRQHATQVSSASFLRQHEKSQALRRRHWNAFWNANGIAESECIDEVLKLRDPHPPAVNMDAVDSAFGSLLRHSHHEARSIVFHHMTKYYFRAAGQGHSVALRWRTLNEEFGRGAGYSTFATLYFLGLMKASPDSGIFQKLKSFYIQMKSWRRTN